jgi:fermentation-respiration switch protein FrsA (DUF1100 family)
MSRWACSIALAALALAAACGPASPEQAAKTPGPAADGAPTVEAQVPGTAAPAAAPAATAESPFEGIWIGTASGQKPIDLVLVVERKDGALVAQAALPAFGSLGDPVADLAVSGGTLTCSIPAMIGQMRVELARSGDALEGTLIATPPGVPDPMRMPIRLEPTVEARKAAGARSWVGQVDAGPQQVVIGLTLAPGPGARWAGSVDIPAQGIGGLPIHVQRAEDGRVTARIPVPGDPTMRLAPDGDLLRGTFSQGQFQAPVEFRPIPVGAPLPPPARKARPQDPQPPFPYEERTVRIAVPAGHTLEGTFTVPAGAGPANRVPGVVLITGSGPQDRDESLMGHRPFAVLADALARRGIAVMRCDDRGVGNSSGDFAASTIDDFASDAAFALMTLGAKPEIDPMRVGFLGHSEGAAAGALAVGLVDADPQAVLNASFLVMLAGTGVDGDAVLREQNVLLLRAAGKSDEEIAPAKAAQAAFLDAVRRRAEDAELRAAARALIVAQVRANGGDPDALPAAGLDAQADSTVAQSKATWMRRFLEVDPAVALRRMTCPVLVLNGSLDCQVSPGQNLPPIEAALKQAGVPATVKILPGLNHLFQPAKTGAFSEYSQIETTMDPSVPAMVADWILAQPPRPPASR